jgi:hypothetical protein
MNFRHTISAFILVVGLLLWAAPVEAAITVVSGTNVCAGSSDGTTVSTAAVDTTGATLIVASVSDHPANSGTISDSQTLTWTTSLSSANATGSEVKLFFAVATSTNASHTFTYSGASTFPAICVIAFAGTHATTPYTGQESTATAASNSVQPGSLTPSEDNCVVVSGLSFNDNAGQTFSISGGWTIAGQVAYSGGQHFGVGLGYSIQTTATASNPTWSFAASSADLGASSAVFKSDGGGGGGGPAQNKKLLLGVGGQ